MPGGRAGVRLVMLAAAVCLIGSADASAERLATRRFTTADGLVSDYVLDVYRDSRGFLWFSTREGLCRFDGVQFASYGVADGLPTSTINAVLETRGGVYWVATNGGGVSRFNPRGVRGREPLFVNVPVGHDALSSRVNVLFEDRAGRLWAGSDDGLFRLESTNGREEFRPVDLGQAVARTDERKSAVGALAEDRDGALWIAGTVGLARLLPDGRLVVYDLEPAGTRRGAGVIAIDRQNRVWAGYVDGLAVFEIDPPPAVDDGRTLIVRVLSKASNGGRDPSLRARWMTAADGLPSNRISALAITRDGHVWVGTTDGAVELGLEPIRSITTRQGLADDFVSAIVEDPAGNIWFGTSSGVTKLAREGLVTYDVADGLATNRIQAIGEDGTGRLAVMTSDYLVNQFDGRRFASVRPNMPADAICSWTCPYGYLDGNGEWWLLSTKGLFHFEGGFRDLARRQPRFVSLNQNGLANDNVFRVFEDRSHGLWIGGFDGGVARWQRPAGSWRTFSDADGLPPLSRTSSRVSAFAEDRSGLMWVGFYEGGVARLRGGRFESFTPGEGAPAGLITAIAADAKGRIWIASSQQGLVRVDDPGAPRPAFTRLTSSDGIATDNVRCLTEDRWGRIYAGTSRGIDRIDPESGTVRHYTVGDGLASDFVMSAFRDRSGALWFGTMSGLSRMDPVAPDAPRTDGDAPPVLISGIRIRGISQPLSELGESAPPPMTLSSDQNQLQVDFFAVTLASAGALKYQYRLEGTDADWSPATDLRRVNYARLDAGSYRFLVRAVRPDGTVSASPAVVSFRVLPPIYLRWWFLTLAAGAVGAVGVAAYQVRVRQLLRLERVRARIATDLHDDIGASLSQIAILAEVARQRSARDLPGAGDPLARIAETSRGLVDSMSDIVWAVNPEADSLSDLVHRMRRFAEDTLGASDIELTFRAPEGGEDLRMGPDIRREILLLLKESVTNVAKHSRCTSVTIDFECDRHRLRLRIADDGVGFDPAKATDGNGVASMRRRVQALAGSLTIDSAPGRGTRIDLTLDRRRLPGETGGLLQS